MALRRCAPAFTLVEVMMVLLILATLAAGLAVPLAAQVHARRAEETRRLLDEAREALLGFAAAHGRLPCPATPASRGEEGFATAGDAANGACERFHDGLLPAAALGLAPLDDEGFQRDAWGTRANRLRYAVSALAVNGVAHPFTRANGLQSATLAGLGAAPHFLFICASGSAVGASCGPASNQLTRRAACVLLSLGPNASLPEPPGGNAARNQDGDAVFVAHSPGARGEADSDDLVTWVPVNGLAARLLAAGRLP